MDTNKITNSNIALQLEQERLRIASEVKANNAEKNNSVSTVQNSNDEVTLGLANAINDAFDNSSKIAELKRLVAEGRYSIDSTKIAEAFCSAVDEEIALERLGNF